MAPGHSEPLTHVFGLLREKARSRVFTGEVGEVMGFRADVGDFPLELLELLEDADRCRVSASVPSRLTLS